MFPLLGKNCTTPMDIRKAQALTIRSSGLDQPLPLMGSLRLGASLIVVVIRHKFTLLSYVCS